MNKHQRNEIAKLAVMHRLGMHDAVARGLSALIRAAMTARARAALLEYAELFAVTDNPDFIV